MNAMAMTDEEHTAFMRGFNLAQPPGPDEAAALKVAEDFAPPGPGQFHLAISKDLAKAFAAEVEPLPETLAAAAWLGFVRGLIAHTGGELVHVHFDRRIGQHAMPRLKVGD